MFKHVLIPTDGSQLSRKAIDAGIAFAKESGARVTGYYALEEPTPAVYGEGYQFPDGGQSSAQESAQRKEGARYVDEIARAAKAAGVAFDADVTKAVSPYEGIVKAAREHDCDVIFMASHGRKGLARLALGSVTSNVLTHSTVPVLVYR
ncbi:MAG TPA: universal stress protein [Burkholderiales bacterium]|nr:universal stress protein [Burkholderiales bacterium]